LQDGPPGALSKWLLLRMSDGGRSGKESSHLETHLVLLQLTLLLILP